MSLSTVALAVSVLASAPGALEDNEDFQAAMGFYRDLEFEQALVKLRLASADPTLNKTDQARALLWIGVTYGGMGDDDAARQSFRDGFKIDRDAPLPDLTPPTVRVIADEERAKAAKAPLPSASQSNSSTAGDGPASDTGSTSGASDEESSGAQSERAPSAGAESEGTLPNPTPDDEGLAIPWFLIGGVSTVAVGALIGVGAAAVGVLAGLSYLFATNPTNFQDEADGAAIQFYVEVAASSALGVGALALLAGGAGLATAELFIE